MTNQAFDTTALDLLDRIYPETPAILHHNLAHHPLFAIESLVALSQRMDPIHVEYNRANLPIGIDADEIPANGLSIEDTIRSLEENGSWMVLKFVEKDPIYRALLLDVLAEIEPVVGPQTGAMHQKEGFIFLSSPNSVTPFHFDPEHNILLQLRGSKTMTQFPAADEDIVPGEQHERFHAGGHRNLPWRDGFEAKGRAFHLNPGDAVYVPVKAPHWVKNGSELSISFSITWRSEWSYAEENARNTNRMLRKLGLKPASPPRFPDSSAVKSTTWRAIRKIGLAE